MTLTFASELEARGFFVMFITRVYADGFHKSKSVSRKKKEFYLDSYFETVDKRTTPILVLLNHKEQRL